MSSQLTFTLVVPDAIEAMTFYETVFDGIRGEVYEFPDKTGLNEANITVGNVPLRLIDANPAFDCYPPNKDEIDSIWLQIVVEDVAAILEKSKTKGATVTQEINEFMGTKHAEIQDPFGYTWTINQILREVSFEERYRFYQEFHEQ
ncbi:VOC family protein [Enterococcus olivae]